LFCFFIEKRTENKGLKEKAEEVKSKEKGKKGLKEGCPVFASSKGRNGKGKGRLGANKGGRKITE
jgi:hypothetical protein